MADTYSRLSWRGRAMALIATAALGGAVAVGAVAPAPAWADNASVTIQAPSNPDAAYDAYCLFTANITNKNVATDIEWSQGVSAVQQTAVANELDALTSDGYTAWLQGKGVETPSNDDKTNPQNVVEFMSQRIGGSTSVEDEHGQKVVEGESFAMQFATWLKNESGIAATQANIKQGEAFTGEKGYYLFVSRGDSLGGGAVATAPIWFPLGGSASEVYEKASSPTVNKTVEGEEVADAQIGDAVAYQIEATLPVNYGSYTEYRMILTDAPSQRLKIDEQSVVVKAGEATLDEKDYTAVLDSPTGQLTVTINNLKTAAPKANNGTHVVVTYNAMLVEGAVTGGSGNQNNVTYKFSNDPFGTDMGTVTDDPVPLYTYQLKLLKQDLHTDVALKDAQFIIRDKQGGYYNPATCMWNASEEDARKSPLTTDDNGALTVQGIAAGTYTLTEVKAPEGYQVPANAGIELTVSTKYDAQGTIDASGFKVAAVGSSLIDASKATEADAATGTLTVTAVNDKNISLAMTGAEGVGLAGVAVLGAGLVLYLVKRRRENADEAQDA